MIWMQLGFRLTKCSCISFSDIVPNEIPLFLDFFVKFLMKRRLVKFRKFGALFIIWLCTSYRLDDPVMWGFKGFPTCNADLQRWVLAAEDICFKNPVLSYFFRLGMCLFLYIFKVLWFLYVYKWSSWFLLPHLYVFPFWMIPSLEEFE